MHTVFERSDRLPQQGGSSTSIGTRSVKALGANPALDGLRGIAWAAVFLGHVQPFSSIAPADTGMFIFFALSGFLITYLAVREYAFSGRIDMAAFIRRRVVRLVPALAVFLIVWMVVSAAFTGHVWLTTVPQGGPGQVMGLGTVLEAAAAALTYVMNWAVIFNWFSGYVPIGHIWSLAIEMQFYLIWVSILAVIFRYGRHAALRLAVAGSLLASADVILLTHLGLGGLRVYMGTDTRAGTLLAGSAAALFWSHSKRELKDSKILPPLALVSVGVILWSGYALQKSQLSVGGQMAWPLTALACATTIIYLVERPDTLLGRIATGRVIKYLGKRSYALYLWHYVWLTWFRSLGFPGIAAGLIMSLITAELSWRLVEEPASKWRQAGRKGSRQANLSDKGVGKAQRAGMPRLQMELGR
ncbi:MAG: acyltransferase [Actinomycetota bacterium]|nr:MAG: acyltransferase [Actinomycetota bacterium]